MPQPTRQTRSERRQAELQARKVQKREQRLRVSREQVDGTTLEQAYPAWLPSLAAALAGLVVLLAIGPLGIFDPALPIAGDQVTHNWWLTEFRDRLFGPGSILGWTDDLSAGYLFGFFYFPLPPLVFSLLSLVVADAIAIKLMVALSLVLIPVGALRLARGLGFSPPACMLAPVVSLTAVFSNQPMFVGGTLYSTLTGEFSYSFSLAFSMLALGEVLLVLRAKGAWWRAGLFLAAAVTSHVLASLPAVLVIAVVLLRAKKEHRPAAVSLVLLSLAASLWWVIPSFTMSHEALGDGHKRVTEYAAWMLPPDAFPLVLAGFLGLAIAWWRRRPGRVVLTALVLSGPVFLLLMPGSFMWNVRIMPWYYTALSLCIAYAAEMLVLRAASVRPLLRAVPAAVFAGAILLAFSIPDNYLLASSIRDSQYGGKSLSGTKYVEEVAQYLSTQPPGRAMVAVPSEWAGVLPARDWETSLPLSTDGKIDSSISLYYEASRSTPAIEYTHSYVAEVAHTSLSWLKYRKPEEGFSTGVRALQLLGIRYYIVGDQKMYDLAIRESSLKFLASVGSDTKLPAHQWAIFEVKGADLVESVRTRIEVVPPLASERAWASAAVNWLDTYDPASPETSPPLPLESGPASFDGTRLYEYATVSNLSVSDERISFDVSRTGTPVLVKVSHSGQWEVTGADGPYRTAPNFMLVLPTESHVELTFKRPFTVALAPLVCALLLCILVLYRVRLARSRINKETLS